MHNHLANARINENTYLMKSEKFYNYFQTKSDDDLIRYHKNLQPTNAINSVISIFDSEKQLKIFCLEEILSSRKASSSKTENTHS